MSVNLIGPGGVVPATPEQEAAERASIAEFLASLTKKQRKSGLSTRDLHALDRAILTLFGPGRGIAYADLAEFLRGTYLVGTAQTGGEYRDVDVRTILADDEFDARFPDGAMWSTFCFLVSEWLAQQTGLPIDYQVQRMTEANAKHDGPRNPLGTGRGFAGYGDATPFDALGQRLEVPA